MLLFYFLQQEFPRAFTMQVSPNPIFKGYLRGHAQVNFRREKFSSAVYKQVSISIFTRLSFGIRPFYYYSLLQRL